MPNHNQKRFIPTVPNDSYRFWAVLPLEGYVLNVADIHKYWSKMQ